MKQVVDSTRRNFLKGAGALLTGTALAGCNHDDGGPGTTEPGTETPTETPYEPETSYELELSVTDELDLSGVYDLLLNQYSGEELADFTEDDWQHAWETVFRTTGIRDEDHLHLEYTITEYLDGERQGEVEPDHLELSFRGENGNHDVELGPEIDNAYDIACTELHEGENQATLTAEVDGETVRETATVRKITPEKRLIEGYVDGEKVTEYWSPFGFDTWHTNRQDFLQRNYEIQKEFSWTEDSLDADNSPFDFIDTDRMQELAEANDKKGLLQYTYNQLIEFGHDNGIIMDSVTAEAQATTQKMMILETTDLEPGDVYASGFNNIAEPDNEEGVNHGSKAFHIEGDWFHQDTTSDETLHVDNVDQSAMAKGYHGYVSVMAEIDRDMTRLDEQTKVNRINRLFGPFMAIIELNAFDHIMNSDRAYNSIENVRNNEDWEEFRLDAEVSTEIALDTGRHNIMMGDSEKPLVFSTTDDTLNHSVNDNPTEYGTGELIEELA